MQSNYHSLPTINDVQQAPGHKHAARNAIYKADDRMAELALDIAGAYPEEAGVDTWMRTVALNRGADIAITESYSLKDVSGGIILNFLTPCEVLLQDDGRISLKASELSEDRMSGTAQIHYDAGKLAASVKEVVLDDGRLKHIWGSSLTRIMLKAKNPSQEDTLKLRITRE